MAALRADYGQFVADYKDALSCGLHFREFLQLTGLSHFVLNDRLKMLAKRGIVLPKLRGMRNRLAEGKRKATIIKRRVARKPKSLPAVRRPTPPADPTFVICVG